MRSTPSGESALFARVLEKPAAQRREFLRELVRDDPPLLERLEELLAAHDADTAAGGVARATIALDLPEVRDDILGQSLRQYKVLQKLGEGGCGAVYMAEQQEPVRRTVALKIIKLGMDTREVVSRFEAERQALALMSHPNIAKVLDAGATESGRPFFVMELVQGVPITHYCDLQLVPTNQRLGLFAQVCQAIQHAHQKGIIHRDIKPSNILVTLQEGVPVPKVIDFGIAKAIGAQRLTEKTMFTELGQFLGTPAYMSPEQAEMSALDIDTRADIYALGVLLYQLLTGRTPFDNEQFLRSGLDEMRRIIREAEPVRPSTRIGTLTAEEQTRIAKVRQADPPRLISRVRGDLDWITMKCLEKDRTRRYGTANDLAADVQRHLANEPILARPPSAGYRLQKTIRRHRLAFAAAAAVLASLVLGLGTATTLFFKEQHARREVTAAAREVDRQKGAAERKNVEYRAMLVEAARLDRTVAEEKFRAGEEPDALAHLARACAFDPESTLAAQTAIASLGTWNPVFPVATLTDHEGSISSAHFSPDGRRVVTASGQTARIWDVTTSQELLVLRGHLATVVLAEYSPDGTRVLTASADKTARLWDAASGQVVTVLAGHEGDLTSAQFSRDGRRVVTASTDQTARVWDATTGRTVATLVGHERPVRCARFSPNGENIVTASEDHTARIWDADSGRHVATFSEHLDSVAIARFSPDGARVVSAALDGTAYVWEAATGRATTKRISHADAILSAQFSPDATQVATTSLGGSVRIWNAATGEPMAELKGHRGAVASAEFSPDGARLVTASSDRTARVFEVATAHTLATLTGHRDAVVNAQFSPDGKHVVTASLDRTARLWLPAASSKTEVLIGHSDKVCSGQFSADDARILTGAQDGTVRQWDAAGRQPSSVFSRQTNEVLDAQYSPDGSRIAIASTETNAHIWIAATGEHSVTLSGHDGELRSARFSANGMRVVTASVDQTARIWDAATGQMLMTLRGHQNRVLSAEFSRDGQRVVTASHDQSARVWESATGKGLLTLAGHQDMVRSACFSPDGRRIVTASFDRTARVWDAGTGQCLMTLTGHAGEVWSAAFSPDGQSIVTASGDQTAKLWDAVSGKLVATFVGHTDRVRSAQFSHDGRRIVTVSFDKTARLWTVLPPSAGAVPEWFGDFLRYLGKVRLNPAGDLESLTVPDEATLRERFRRVRAGRTEADSPYVQILRKYVAD